MFKLSNFILAIKLLSLLKKAKFINIKKSVITMPHFNVSEVYLQDL